MTPDQSAQLDHLLSLWHFWSGRESLARGHSSKSQVVGDCRGYGLQYESQLEQQDVALENRECSQVNHEVRQLHEPHRTAIYVDARNLCTGLAVWDSPRLPTDRAAREFILLVARQLLVGRLIAAGVME